MKTISSPFGKRGIEGDFCADRPPIDLLPPFSKGEKSISRQQVGQLNEKHADNR
jgi:hypothetical protein